MAVVRLEGLGKLKKIQLGQAHGLPACSIVSQPSTLPHAPLLLQDASISNVGGHSDSN
jgi:hypothetical protein